MSRGVIGRKLYDPRSTATAAAFRPAGRYNDRHPAHLRDLAPTVETIVTPNARPLTTVKTNSDGKRETVVIGYGRATIRGRIDRGANRRQARADAREHAEQERMRLRQIAHVRRLGPAAVDVPVVIRRLGPEDAAWALGVRVEDLPDLAGVSR